MNEINLLPYREIIQRKIIKMWIFSFVIGVILGMILFSLVWFSVLSHENNENSRLKYLKNITRLEGRTATKVDILTKENKKISLDMIKMVQWSKNRNYIEKLLRVLGRNENTNVEITNLSLISNVASIKGKSKSNADVSNFLTKIKNDKWVESAKLTNISTATISNSATIFSISINMKKES